jgi:hypothetical protein
MPLARSEERYRQSLRKPRSQLQPLVGAHHFQFAGDVAEIDVDPDDCLLAGVDQKEVGRATAVIGAQPLPFPSMLARTSGSGNRIEETVSAETIAARAVCWAFPAGRPAQLCRTALRSVLRERHLVPTRGSE